LNDSIESYLKRLDLSLKGIPVSDKINILEEARGKLAKGEVLSSPEDYALSFLPDKKSGGCLKLFLKLSLVSLLLFIGAISFLTWKYSPFIEIDDEENLIQLFGGRIKLDFDEEKFFFGDFRAASDLEEFSGRQEMSGLSEAEVLFLNGSIQVGRSLNENFVWDCEVPDSSKLGIKKESEAFIIDLKKQLGIKCKLKVPGNKGIKLLGNNGSIQINDLQSDIQIKMDNGSIQLNLDEEKFQPNIRLGRGANSTSGFSGSEYQLEIDLESGAISN